MKIQAWAQHSFSSHFAQPFWLQNQADLALSLFSTL
jgi:hypothetical protein